MYDDELTPEQKFAAESAETMVPRAIMRGRSRESIVAELVRLDWEPAAAEAVIDRALDDLRRYYGSPTERAALVIRARVEAFAGLLVAVAGALFTLLAYVLLAAGGITFALVPFGITAAGCILCARGWTRMRFYGQDRLPIDDPK